MKLLLLPLLLWPVFLFAQEVKPILSKDYQDLINKKNQPGKIVLQPDTMNSIRNSPLNLYTYFNGSAIRKIKKRNNTLHILHASPKEFRLAGQITTTIEARQVNKTPNLQSEYVQGRSQNGARTWRGPETGELFSYGPAINSLEFDGSAYDYDINGKLVATGSGSGRQAIPYSSKIFRTAFHTSKSLTVQGKIMKNYQPAVSITLKAGQSNENIFLREQTNNSRNISITVEALIRQHKLIAGYTSLKNDHSASNRNSFLNRIYQNALLSPVSFDNTQGTVLVSSQRSYSVNADNPFFLLENNGNSFFQTHRTGSLGIERRRNRVFYKIMQSIESHGQVSNEVYKPWTAYFLDGVAVNRKRNDLNYFLKANASWNIRFDNTRFSSELATNYVYSNSRTNLAYQPGVNYHYQRSTNDLSLSISANYRPSEFEAGIKLENKLNTSNTSNSDDFFLPSVSAYNYFYDLFGCPKLMARLSGTYSQYNSELPIDQSLANYNLTLYSASQALQYFPLTEIAGYGGLDPIRNEEWRAKAELNYLNGLYLHGEVFIRSTRDDIMPIFENGNLILKNIADHRDKGIELEIGHNNYGKKFTFNNQLSFYANRKEVTGVSAGYNFTPIAGFSNVHKAIVLGQAPGAIVGSSFARDAQNNILIGADGYPLVNTASTVIGNPVPDFVVKMSNSIKWKKLSFNLSVEWKNGGQTWNGTQAILDYYGRSSASEQYRNTTNYTFDGVKQDGHRNTTPVTFYDPSQPFELNRWVRYGHGGVAEEYIQPADHLRINSIGFSYLVNFRKYIHSLRINLYAQNIILWTPYQGGDPNQLLYGQFNSNGLDFFNLPSTKTLGFNVSIQF